MILVVSVPFLLLEAALDCGIGFSFYHLRNNPWLLVLATSFALLRSSSFSHIDCSSLLSELVLQMFCAQLLFQSCARSHVHDLGCSSGSKKCKSLPSSCMKGKSRLYMYLDPGQPLCPSVFLQISEASMPVLSLKLQVMKHFSGNTDAKNRTEPGSPAGWRRYLASGIAYIKAKHLYVLV